MRRAWIPALAVLAAGCSSPTAAEPPPLPAGAYFLQVGARAFDCNRFSDTTMATTVTANITAIVEGETWVGRPAGAESGSFEIRITRSGSATPVQAQVSGTFEGQAQDVGRPPAVPPQGIVARTGARVAASGDAFGSGYMTVLVMNGPVTFVKGTESVTCGDGGAMLSISRNPPIVPIF
jgi:hypothetical protein